MIKKLKPEEVVTTRPFGGFCPYYYRDEAGGIVIGDHAEEIIEVVPKDQRQLDPVACLELLNFNYPLGDRTLIRNVRRMPWHASLDGLGVLTRSIPISHGHRLADTEVVAGDLFACLEEEIASYLQGHKRVWILLSGGLDSRITAGIVRRLQRDFDTEVMAAAWGDARSRDVVYSQRIARHFNWEWHHLRYDETTLWENLNISACWGGAEVAAVHFHAENELGKLLQREDLVLASSWGDSVGRAEFSGAHLSYLVMPPIVNRYWMIHRSLFPDCCRTAQADRELAWCTEIDRSKHIIAELDSQENYMRRMIGHAMNYVASFARLEQTFTAEKTVRTMWSYSPACRQNEVYFHLLKRLDPFLSDVPWARNGISPSGLIEQDHTLTASYHAWGKWLRQGRWRELRELVCEGGLGKLGVFNMSQVRMCFKLWRSEPPESVGLTENILQLAAIELLRRRFELAEVGDRTTLLDAMMSVGYRVGDRVLARIRGG